MLLTVISDEASQLVIVMLWWRHLVTS